jgi:hypothetical protein
MAHAAVDLECAETGLGKNVGIDSAREEWMMFSGASLEILVPPSIADACRLPFSGLVLWRVPRKRRASPAAFATVWCGGAN